MFRKTITPKSRNSSRSTSKNKNKSRSKSKKRSYSKKGNFYFNQKSVFLTYPHTEKYGISSTGIRNKQIFLTCVFFLFF